MAILDDALIQERVTALPAPGDRTPSTIYFVRDDNDSELLDIYVTSRDSDTLETRHILNKADISTLIQDALGADSSVLTAVPDIAARDALTLTKTAFVLVIDATGDATVANGAALYIWDSIISQFIKVSEYESLDLKWSGLSGRPTSLPSAIDSAVAASHTHSNKVLLDLFSVDTAGNLTFNGKYFQSALAKSEW